MRKLLAIVLLLVPAMLAWAQDETTMQGAVKVTKILTPAKELRFAVEVPAPVDQVWQAMTTAEGLKTWLTPDAKVDLRAGGDWLAIFPGGVAPGGGPIVSFVPEKSITLRAMAPTQFPTVRQERTLAVFELKPVDAKTTRVTLQQTGWKEGKEWDDAFEYLSKGNPQLLNALRQRFVSGPIDWAAVMAKH